MASCSFTHNGRTFTLEVVETGYSVANNTSDIRWTLSISGGGGTWYNSYAKATVNGSIVYNETKDWSTGSFPAKDGSESGTITGIAHDSLGKKSISFALEGYSYSYNTQYTSGSLTLTDIPRKAEITSAPNFNDEESPTITYTNNAGNNVTTLQACISLTGSSDDISYRNISKTGSSYTFELTENERNVLRNACTSSNSRSVIFFIKTVLSGNTYYSTLTKTLSIVNGNPTFEDTQLSYLDTDNTVVAITENDQHIVRNQSNLEVTYTAATAKKGASISSYEIIFNGQTITKNSASTIDYGTVNLSSNSTLKVKAIDSRGNSTTISKTIQIKDWVLPSATITAGRVNNYEDETHLKANVTISSVGGKNAIQSIKYRYKKSGTSDYSSYVNMSNNVQSTVSIDKLYAWDFQIAIADKFGSTTYNFTIAKGMPIMFIDTKKLAVGINVFPSSNNAFDIDGNLKVDGNLNVKNITGTGTITNTGNISNTGNITNTGTITTNGSLTSKNSLLIKDSNGNTKAKLDKDGLYFDGKNVTEVSLAMLVTNDAQTFTQSASPVTVWGSGFEYGDYKYNTSGGYIEIKNTELCEISGAFGGNDFAWARLEISESNTVIESYPTLVQTAGNGYFFTSLQTAIIRLDPTKTYHLFLTCAPYNVSSFTLNAGFGNSGTWIGARKIK